MDRAATLRAAATGRTTSNTTTYVLGLKVTLGCINAPDRSASLLAKTMMVLSVERQPPQPQTQSAQTHELYCFRTAQSTPTTCTHVARNSTTPRITTHTVGATRRRRHYACANAWQPRKKIGDKNWGKNKRAVFLTQPASSTQLLMRADGGAASPYQRTLSRRQRSRTRSTTPAQRRAWLHSTPPLAKARPPQERRCDSPLLLRLADGWS